MARFDRSPWTLKFTSIPSGKAMVSNANAPTSFRDKLGLNKPNLTRTTKPNATSAIQKRSPTAFNPPVPSAGFSGSGHPLSFDQCERRRQCTLPVTVKTVVGSVTPPAHHNLWSVTITTDSTQGWMAEVGRPMLWRRPTEAFRGTERHVKLFKNGRNQAVRIPREFELPGEDAVMRKEGDRLIIEPSPPRSLLAVLAMLRPLDEDFPPIADPPPDPVAL